jgi:hypothetical protein
MRNHGAISHYEGTLRLLAERGHRVLIGSRGAERHYATDMQASMDRLCRECPGITAHKLPRRADDWAPLAETVRSLRNYCRYLHPRYVRAQELRERAARQVTRVSGLTRLPRSRLLGLGVTALASALERRIPVDSSIEKAIERMAPDVVVVTPLVDFNSYLPDYVTAAARLGIPTVWAVASWDNLTNKGVVGHVPDRVLVWNEAQRQEAVTLQRVPASRVVVTGAQTFDPWFTLSASTSRDAFSDLVGLARGPYLLYLCSSLFIAPNESTFVREWLTRLRRSSHENIRDLSVLIRPHPATAGQWASLDLREYGPVAVWPRAGDLPLESAAKQRYFDSLFHASLLVGVNSSSMIEGGIVGRRSFTILEPQFAHSQAGTIHFDHLTKYGFVTTARTWEEHFSQIAGAFPDQGHVAETVRERMLSFVRPAGADQAATPRVVAAIEEAAALKGLGRHAARTPLLLMRLLAPLSRAAARAHAKARDQRRSSPAVAAPPPL